MNINLYTVKYQYLELWGTSTKLRDIHGFEISKLCPDFKHLTFPLYNDIHIPCTILTLSLLNKMTINNNNNK